MAKQPAKKKAPAKKKSSSSTARKGCDSPMPAGNSETTTSVRKISNGYVVRQSTYGNGKYQEKETFTKTKPSIDIKPAG